MSGKRISKYLDQNTVLSDNSRPLSRFFFRPLSLLITPLFVRARLSPNLISFFRLLVSIVAMLLLFSHDFQIRIIGILVFTFSEVLDYVDGNVARVMKSKTFFGKWFDGLVDLLTILLIIIPVGSYTQFGLAGGIGIALCVGMSNYIIVRYNGILNNAKRENGDQLQPATEEELSELSSLNLPKFIVNYTSSLNFWRVKKYSNLPFLLYSKYQYLVITFLLVADQGFYLSWLLLIWSAIMLVATFLGTISNALKYLYVSRN